MNLPHQSLRQSTASLCAYALCQLFPGVQLVDCLVSQVGFTYTFSLKQRLEEGMLPLIEEKMRAIVKSAESIRLLSMMRENAVDLFKHFKQPYKAEAVAACADNIVSVLKFGESFYDYGLASAVDSLEELRVFKLQALESVKDRESTYCITGTAFPYLKDLKNFLKNFESAKKYDHRRLGQELGLFTHVNDPDTEGWFWFPKGAYIKQVLLDWLKNEMLAQGFEVVSTPRIVKNSLLRQIGVLEKERKLRYAIGDESALVNQVSPLHALLFQLQQHSYRELPVRYFEQVEILTPLQAPPCGLFYSSINTVDRSHVFCTAQEVLKELISSLQFIDKTIKILGFEYQWYLLPRGNKFAGTVEKWDKVLSWMTEALQVCNCQYVTDSLIGAFEGPRMIVRMKDAMGREWDGPFIEVNFRYLEAFNLRYQGSDDEMHPPHMIVRSIFGSLERCIAALVEHWKGVLPLWVAPEQVRLLPVGASHCSYAENIRQELKGAGIRCSIDCRSESLGAKVHAVEREKIPYACIIGDAEIKSGVLNIRSCSRQGQMQKMALASFLQKVQAEAALPTLLLKDTKSYSEE